MYSIRYLLIDHVNSEISARTTESTLKYPMPISVSWLCTDKCFLNNWYRSPLWILSGPVVTEKSTCYSVRGRHNGPTALAVRVGRWQGAAVRRRRRLLAVGAGQRDVQRRAFAFSARNGAPPRRCCQRHGNALHGPDRRPVDVVAEPLPRRGRLFRRRRSVSFLLH